MKCPSCATELVHDTRALRYASKSESTIIPAVTGDFCPACNEVVLDATASTRISKALREINRLVTASGGRPKRLS